MTKHTTPGGAWKGREQQGSKEPRLLPTAVHGARNDVAVSGPRVRKVHGNQLVAVQEVGSTSQLRLQQAHSPPDDLVPLFSTPWSFGEKGPR